ncbi:ATP-binding cassette domain-containing protein [Prescottella equi]|uniref:ATP-binding cassette domain-containing protein n=1 Tax=Rhodococcus hoagii TaxID=43767 RepID=A0A9Q5WSY0_RHOHA|nr:ATP-binding cassette domain-containing protein [Prescottella equi]MBM4489201.1 ATP-binding cassette domain-containing protein [Prescottella equi]MBM4495935.1 ATP-binding cassette domain-containing protein [Prescottella equi]MBM4497361.1 ATP-binding cassette domain-containing protein [Prescottella equi]MBM4507104.1 ATP-binding cassette domain-containing protein [Prescottella equi]MBM4507290.1 ATP-binding cassette domain-containing protein [Prescottella equi]
MNPQSVDHAVAVTGLRKAFGERTVLGGVDLHVPTGSVFALLGANGAGKTTTVRVLSTLLPFDAGQVRVAGHALPSQARAVRADISVTGQYASVDKLSTGRENLALMGELHHLGRRGARARADELLHRFDLVDAADRRADTYSGGMRRRLDLAMSLVARPKVLFLDEPTAGLDPRSRRDMWDMVRELVREGTTILLTTQYLDEAEALADRIAVLDGGRIVAEGSADELKRLVPGGHVELRLQDGTQAAAAAAALPEAVVDSETATLTIPTDGSIGSLGRILARLDDRTLSVERFALHTPDLDDVFFALTGSEKKEAVR